MFEFLSPGILLDLASGVLPGPLLILVISEHLKYNTKAVYFDHTGSGTFF
jgi:hypothetical protein